MGKTYKDSAKHLQTINRYRLLTHYELIALVKSKNPRNTTVARNIASHIVHAMYNDSVTDYDGASVLTMHEKTMIANANNIRRSAIINNH